MIVLCHLINTRILVFIHLRLTHKFFGLKNVSIFIRRIWIVCLMNMEAHGEGEGKLLQHGASSDAR